MAFLNFGASCRDTERTAANGSRAIRLGAKVCALIVAGTIMAGCATTSTNQDPQDEAAVAEYEQVNDPLEPVNRVFFEFNRGLDTLVLRPVATLYSGLIPPPIQDIVHNFLNNLKSPVILLNDLLQGEMVRAGQTLTRFAINSTIGILGMGDPATSMGYARHSEDFGQTLGTWGMGEGVYLVLPIFGPSNPRDVVGKVVDVLTDPVWQYAQNTDKEYIPNQRFSAEMIDFRARNMAEIDDLEKTSLDYYAAVRSLYRQVRSDEIQNGASPINSGLPAMSMMDDMSDPDTQNESLATKK
jgi:phospholipid-binding lipoprotein MlaA